MSKLLVNLSKNELRKHVLAWDFPTFSELKRASAPPGHVVKEAKTPGSPKADIPKDMDSDFAELNPLDDVDVSDQLIKKAEVYSEKVEYIYCDPLL